MGYGLSHAPSFSRKGAAPSHGFCNCCCWMALSILLLLVIAVGITALFILVMRPTKPQFSLEHVNIQDFHVDRQDSVNPDVYLSMNITLIFSATNPNKMAILYSATDLDCLYKNTTLGVAKVPAFRQPAHRQTMLTAIVIVDKLYVMEPPSTDLANDASVSDRVLLGVSVPVEARMRVMGISTPKAKVFVTCNILVRPQELGVESKQCTG